MANIKSGQNEKWWQEIKIQIGKIKSGQKKSGRKLKWSKFKVIKLKCGQT